MSEPKLPEDFKPTEPFQCEDCEELGKDRACGFYGPNYDRGFHCDDGIGLNFAQQLAACYNAFRGLPVEVVRTLGKPKISTDSRGRLVVRFTGPEIQADTVLDFLQENGSSTFHCDQDPLRWRPKTRSGRR